ncbi:hypothetical protein NT6N_24830 [Oceaniferula spumae]|uniref:Lipoprotein n=1 Tax=Oceaniferula spumae TaxID=2979115 RepID=A0AAT9FNA8_9BACT
MKKLRIAVLLSFVAILLGCGRSAYIPWEDGDYKVYATDVDYSATALGLDHDPGLLGIVDSEVVAAGSNDLVIVVERENHKDDCIEFYIVTKGDNYAVGPFDEEEFQVEKSKRGLPDFSWRKR